MTINFAVIGVNHDHIYGMTEALKRGGAKLTAFHAPEDDLAAGFAARFPEAKRVADERAILEDRTIQCVASAAISCERAPLGVRVMRHGKDYFVDKPGVTDLQQLAELRLVARQTGQKYFVCFSERFENRATVKAGELVKAGAIGKVIQTVGLGPHRLRAPTRPAWFFSRAQYGGVLCDIASHQFDQFLYFTGASSGEIVASQVANRAHPQWPELEDFGDALVKAEGASGYIRVDWFTPDGLKVWGDGRLTILGTEGYIELRKYIDIEGRAGGDHLFLADAKGTRYLDCSSVEMPMGPLLVADIQNRTEIAMTQAHCFAACELALQAQARAVRL